MNTTCKHELRDMLSTSSATVNLSLDCISVYVPSEPITTDSLLGELDGRLSEKLVSSIRDMRIRQRSSVIEDLPNYLAGRRPRRVIETTSSMAANAIRQCLEKANVDPANLAALITVTNTPDQLVPGVVYLVMEKLLDVLPRSLSVQGLQAAGCSGAVKALELARLYLMAHPGKQVLVVAAESQSAYMPPLDDGGYLSFRELRNHPGDRGELLKTQRVTGAFLFGDGAAALLLGERGRTGLSFGRIAHATNLQSSDMSILVAAQHGMINPDAGGFPEYIMDRAVPTRGLVYAAKTIERLFDAPEGGVDETMLRGVDSFLIHTGSWKILEGVCRRFGVSATDPRVGPGFRVIERYANTSSCSTGFLLQDLLDGGLAGSGVLLSFGVGFSASSLLYTLTPAATAPQVV